MKNLKLYEHEEYSEDVRAALENVPNAVLAKGRPQKLVVGGEVGGKEILDVYTVALLAE
jgi:hypothetical protein